MPVEKIAAETFDPRKAEQNEMRAILEKGVQFQIPRVGLLHTITGKRTSTWRVREPYLGTLDRLSELSIRMELNEEALRRDPMGEAKRLVGSAGSLCARAVAVSVLNNRILICLFARPLGRLFFWRLTPSALIRLVVLINTMGNYADFIGSIRLMSSARTTAPAPALMETMKPASNVA